MTILTRAAASTRQRKDDRMNQSSEQQVCEFTQSSSAIANKQALN
jgi:hypothetical protein